MVEELTIEPVGFSPLDEHALLVDVEATGKMKGSGLPLSAFPEGAKWVAVVTMRDGMCARMEVFRTKSDALEAVGLSE